MTRLKDPQQTLIQAHRLFALARRRQLDTALRGDLAASARFACRAQRVQTTTDRLARPQPVAPPSP